MLGDIRYSIRSLLRSPGFTFIAVLTLAIGIGGNTSIFSVVRTVLLDPLPYSNPEELVVVGGQVPGLGSQDLTASPDEFRDYTEQAGSLKGLAASWLLDINITGIDRPARGQAALVSTNFMSVLNATPMLGRDFEESDAANLGVGYVAILSYSAWKRFYGEDPEVIGKSIRIDDDPLTIIGVMPPGFSHPGESPTSPVDIWGSVDLSENSRFGNFRNFRPLHLVGRLADGVDIRTVQTEFQTITANLRREYPQSYPEEAGWSASVMPLLDRMVGDVRTSLFVLFGSVGLVLLVACTNVANLLLARGAAQSRELAIRTALGGGRAAVGRQFVLTSLMLGVAGGLVGLLLASVGTELVKTLASGEVPRLEGASVDFSVLGFTFLLALAASLVFGIIPAVQLSRGNVQELLKEGARGTTGGAGRLRDLLVVVEIALSLVLLFGSGLLLKSFSRLMDVEPGFDPQNVITMRAYLPWTINPQDGRYFQMPARIDFFQETLRRIEELPEVSSAAITSRLPLRRVNGGQFSIEGMDDGGNNLARNAELRQVSANYFTVMGIPLISGSFFTGADDGNSIPKAIVDQAWVSRYLGAESAVGKRLRLGNSSQAPWLEVVGVVGSVRQQALDAEARGTIYTPFLQGVGIDMTYVVKTLTPPERLASPVVAAIHTVDPTLPIFAQATMEQVIADTVAERRLLLLLLSGFAAQALLLAAIGIYGVISQSVSYRARELGIRMALGARPGRVLGLVLSDGVKLSLVGVVVGIGVAAALSRVLSSMLYAVAPFDPLVFGAVALVSVGVALAATVIPAVRATRVDPLVTMKAE